MVPTLAGGGAERNYLHLAKGFQQAGYNVDLILKSATGAYVSQVPDAINIIDLKASRMALTLPGVVRYLRTMRPCAMLAGLELPNLIAIMAQVISRIPTNVIVTVHSIISQGERFFLPHRTLEKLLMKLLYPRAGQIVTVSQGTAKDFSRYLGIPNSKIRVIYNPVITPELLEKAQQPLEHPWFEPGQPPVILGLGRLDPVKDYPTLIRAFSRVRQHASVRLLILGEGDQREGLERLVKQLGLTDDVCLPGFQQNPFPFLHHAAVLALSSLHEAAPSVIIQALACDCPVVATDCPGGVRELVGDGKFGHLVPVGDDEAMAQAVLEVLDGDARKPSREWLRQFELDRVIRQYLDLL